ncbi:hypothetical protein, partial [Klebsiella pneumoniae]|uniref:hypothetical protein n=1 Tax=Klebsiella pneumoniae TaxID=573 RepID=UPI001953260E
CAKVAGLPAKKKNDAGVTATGNTISYNGFWALGGGKGNEPVIAKEQKGLNLNLPDAKMKDENLTDKLSFYDKA